METKRRVLLLGTVSLVAGVFAADVFLPWGNVAPVLYACAVLLSFLVSRRPYPVILAAACSLLIVLAFSLRPGGSTAVDVINRSIAELLTWTTLVLGYLTKRTQGDRLIGPHGQDEYQRLFDSNPAPTWVVDSESLAFLAVNQAAIRHYGYSREEILRMTVLDIRPPEDIPRLLELLPKALASSEPRMWPGKHRKKDGTIIHVEVGAQALTFAGRPARLVTASDVTERKQAEVVRRQVLEKVISAQEEERRRIAHGLHDETGQLVASLLVGLRGVESAPTLEAARAKTGELRRIAARTLEEVQRLARGLRPGALDDLGLQDALKRQAAEFRDNQGIPVDLHVSLPDGHRLPPLVETALYRIVQEALTNTAKHAAAKMVSIVLQRTASAVNLVVEDDGCGFDTGMLQSGARTSRHLGLHGMRERASLLSGRFSIESRPMGGTAVYVTLPVEEPAS
ncbi:MAG: PAS domain-containing sensor histidine kinase [Deltaproteobacteria bacterium]|nr:PAS domain-containing sensor histidine kinase [Deltaproteobacteria bacterium]